MKFSIGTASSNIEFDEDIRLIKSSLLYADEIELIGMAEYSIFNYLPRCLTSGNDIERIIQNIITLLKAFECKEATVLLQQLEDIQTTLQPFMPYLKKKKNRTKQEIIVQQQMKKAEIQCRELLSNACTELMSNSNATEIRNLIDRKIISVYDYSYNGFSLDELTGGYFANLLGTIKHSGAYPLFDKVCADIVGHVVDNKFLDFGQIDKEIIRHAGIANNILSNLPTLEKASIDEILDFKKDMKIPLDNFRMAVYGFSEKISSLPWDKDFEYECLKLYDTEVIPKVNEINELSSETSVLKNFGAKVLADETERKKLGFAGAGLITAITTESNMFDALGMMENFLKMGAKIGLSAAGISAFLKTADVLKQAYTEVKEKKKDIKNNVMYYYYKASKKI